MPEDAGASFRVVLPYWSVADALGQVPRWLGESTEAEVGLEAFLPVVAANAPDRKRRCRVAVASTLLAGLELARDGVLTLTQTSTRGQINVRSIVITINPLSCFSRFSGLRV